MELTIGVIGLGYVGLPLALEFAHQGIRTFGFDISKNKIDSLLNGKNYIEDIDAQIVSDSIKEGKLLPTGDFMLLKECDAIYICVPTPIYC